MDFNQIQMKLLFQKDSKRYCLEHSNKPCNVKCLCLHYDNAKSHIMKYAWTFFFFLIQKLITTEKMVPQAGRQSCHTCSPAAASQAQNPGKGTWEPERGPRIEAKEGKGAHTRPSTGFSWPPDTRNSHFMTVNQILTSGPHLISRWNVCLGERKWQVQSELPGSCFYFVVIALISGYVAHRAGFCHNRNCDLNAALTSLHAPSVDIKEHNL